MLRLCRNNSSEKEVLEGFDAPHNSFGVCPRTLRFVTIPAVRLTLETGFVVMHHSATDWRVLKAAKRGKNVLLLSGEWGSESEWRELAKCLTCCLHCCLGNGRSVESVEHASYSGVPVDRSVRRAGSYGGSAVILHWKGDAPRR